MTLRSPQPNGTKIDPDWLEDRKDRFVCIVCMMVMVEPTSGHCRHSVCKGCYVRWLAGTASCPACRRATQESELERDRNLEEEISEARVHCINWGGADGGEDAPVAKFFRPATEVEGRRLGVRGCGWLETMGEIWGHLESCEWEPVVCARDGCSASMLRKDVAAHNETACAFRPMPCTHCNESQPHGQLASHEGSCPSATVPCPNSGCEVVLARKDLGDHREACEREMVACPCPGCDVELLRGGMDAHVDAGMGEHNLRGLMRELARKDREIAELKAVVDVYALLADTAG